MVVLFLSYLVPISEPARAGQLLRLEMSADAMGSTYTLAIYDQDRNKLETAAAEAFDEVRRLDALLSNYKHESEWSRVNRYAAERPVPVSAELFDLLAACQEYSRASDGAFDVSVGPLMKVWGFYKGSGKLPGPGEIDAARDRTGYRFVVLDPVEKSVRFRKAGIELDPGGIGKGYAIDKMAAVLRINGIHIGLISAANSSIYAIGAPPGEPGWPVDIRNPKSPSQTIEKVVLKDQSMSTSGTYEKFFEANGHVYSHIMDPRTGYPAPGMLSVSVIALRTIDSEAWTKPFFINGREWAAHHRPKGIRAYFCEDKAEQSCAWLQ